MNSTYLALEVGWACFVQHETREFGIDLLGTNAGLSLYPAKLFRNTLEGQETLLLNAAKVPYPEDRLHHFVNCVLDGRKPLVAPEESLKVQQVLDAIYTSAASGKEVRLGTAHAAPPTLTPEGRRLGRQHRRP